MPNKLYIPKVGDRVEGGKGEDLDAGRVMSVDRKSKIAMVAWDSLVVTPAPFDVLRKIR